MKAKPAALMFRFKCLPSLAAVALAASLAGFAHAGPTEAAAEGAISLPATQGMVQGLQDLFKTSVGQDLLKQDRSLTFFTWLKPESEFHQSVVGALGLPAGFEAALRSAVKTSDKPAMQSMGAEILSAYRDKEVKNSIARKADAHANGIAAALDKGQLSREQISAAFNELEPFVSISTKARNVIAIIRSSKAIEDAYDIATGMKKS